MWVKVQGGIAFYIGCVCVPTDITNSASIEGCYEKHKEDVLSFRKKGRVVLINAGLVSL